MALLMSSKQEVFFQKLFGEFSPEVTRVKSLQDGGYSFDTSLYSIVAANQSSDTSDSLTLTASTISLLNGTLSTSVLSQNKVKISEWLKGLPQTATAAGEPQVFTVMLTGLDAGTNKLAVIKAVRDALPTTVPVANPLGHAKALVESLVDGNAVPLGWFTGLNAAQLVAGLLAGKGIHTSVKPGNGLGMAPVPPSEPVIVKPVSQVIALKDAKALGQKVHGTSPGSVYHVIALTPSIKVAARVSGTAISLRAEWTQHNADVSKLASVGMNLKSNYASWHLDTTGVPAARVIGAFLMDTGIVWAQAVKAGTELVVNS